MEMKAHNVYKPIAVGGVFSDATPSASAVVGGHSLVGSINGPNRVHWVNGVTKGGFFPFDFSIFVRLANEFVSETYSNGYSIVVRDQGATPITVDSASVLGAEPNLRGVPQGEDNGRTLLVFQGPGTVTLVGTGATSRAVAGRQFGPTVFAPSAHVIVDGSSGFVDGSIIARSLSYSGGNAQQVQVHGNCYHGPLPFVPGAPVVAPAPAVAKMLVPEEAAEKVPTKAAPRRSLTASRSSLMIIGGCILLVGTAGLRRRSARASSRVSRSRSLKIPQAEKLDSATFSI